MPSCHKIVTVGGRMKTATEGIGFLVALGAIDAGRAGLGAGRAQRLLLGAGRMVQADPNEFAEDHRHQGRHDAEGFRRDARAAERRGANPKADVWFGGTGDPHLQAAEEGLTEAYKSPKLAQLHDWAQQQAKQSERQDRRHLLRRARLRLQHRAAREEEAAGAEDCWADLLKPEYKGEIQVANPTRAAPPTR